MNGITVAVLRGGPSEEYEVSMQTGFGVLQALKDSPYNAKDITITKKGEWLAGGFVKTPEQALTDVDVVFIALHGAYGEDGTVQRILERLSVPYTGSGPYASGVAMNKYLTKQTLKSLGIVMPRHMRITKSGATDPVRVARSVGDLFEGPYIIKPTKGGSSIGTELVQNISALSAAIARLLETHEEVLVEEFIKGREATVGILENFREQRYYMLPAVEIIVPAANSFFTSQAKRESLAEFVSPTSFSANQKELLYTTAQAIHQTLGLSQYSRSDFVVTDSDIYFLEVNTMPGFSRTSPFVAGLESIGASPMSVIEHIIREKI